MDRRPRAARACDACRAKKNKCDELSPCTYCKKHAIDCLYKGQASSTGRNTSAYVRQLEEHIKELSDLLESQRRAAEAPHPKTRIDDTILSQQRQHVESFDACPTPSSSTRPPGQEVSGVNRHTRNMEFYGSSSSVALLSHLNGGDTLVEPDTTLVSSLHNPAFTPPETRRTADMLDINPPGAMYHYPQCRGFLETFFLAVHFIHPILEKPAFFKRCETLWSQPVDHPPSFVALYYSLLSFGALISPRDEEPTSDMDNLQWSRFFFKEAAQRCSQLVMVTDLEMVQCYFFLAKVCQNEIMPHAAYMYVGIAVRTALAIGINRLPRPNTGKSSAQIRAESRTWWGLYSLETEMSFAMGRPDTLGSDLYHNQRFPLIRDVDTGDPDLLEHPQCAIIKSMVDFSRLTRQVCLGIYLAESSVSRTVDLTLQIEQDLNDWLRSLPPEICPRLLPEAAPSLKDARSPQWIKRQRLVLTIRYHNLRILMFGSLLLRFPKVERETIPNSFEGVQKCIDSAKQTVEIIYQTLQHNDFFRTWFYNTTYTIFAASVILVYVTREALEPEVQPLLQFVGMAVDILELMSESVVAQAASKLLRRARDAAEQKPGMVPDPVVEDGSHLNHYWGRLDLLDGDMDLDTMFQLANFDNEAFFMPQEPQM